MSKATARVSNEKSDTILESFKVGPITLKLELPEKRNRDWQPIEYSGDVVIDGNKISVHVGSTSVRIDFMAGEANGSYAVDSKEIDKWGYVSEYNDEIILPDYSKIRSFISDTLAKYKANFPKFVALSKIKSIGGNPVELEYGDYTEHLGSICVIGWTLVDYPVVSIGFDLFDESASIYVKQRTIHVDIDIDSQSPAEIISILGAKLNSLGFPGEKHAEIDVILRDKRLNQGKRVLRYDVKDYSTVLEKLKAVLETHKVHATLNLLTKRTAR